MKVSLAKGLLSIWIGGRGVIFMSKQLLRNGRTGNGRKLFKHLNILDMEG